MLLRAVVMKWRCCVAGTRASGDDLLVIQLYMFCCCTGWVLMPLLPVVLTLLVVAVGLRQVEVLIPPMQPQTCCC